VASYGLPLKLHIVVAIVAAIVTGLLLEHWQRRQAGAAA
jgi:hypothetical protein